MDIRSYNRDAWNREVEGGASRWTQAVSPELIALAKTGQFSIVLTENKPVPFEWFPPIMGADVLCLASGGGQQGPILAAAGAMVTVLDNSPKQLERDARAAAQHGLAITTVHGDMAHLEMFPDETFHLVVHPVSNCFVPDVRPVWREASRVLRHGGSLLAGFVNPAIYIFDLDLAERTGRLEVKHSLPYADGPKNTDEPLEFSHTLEEQIGGQIAAGLSIIGMYEDFHSGGNDNPFNR